MSEQICFGLILFLFTIVLPIVLMAKRIGGVADSPMGPAPKFDTVLLSKSRGRAALRVHDVPQTVAARADELARTIVDSVALGGPGILKTYVENGAAEQLYEDALLLLRVVDGHGRLGIELWPPKVVKNPEAPIEVRVRYVVHPKADSAEKRILRLETWRWGPKPRRCEVCGAPNRSAKGSCEYCGAPVVDEQRWILREVVVTASPGLTEPS